jgi:hypothetical protein
MPFKDKQRKIEYDKEYCKANKEHIAIMKHEYSQLYNQSHKKEIQEYRREYRLSHKDMIRESSKEYRELHRLEISAKAKEKYRLEHKDRVIKDCSYHGDEEGRIEYENNKKIRLVRQEAERHKRYYTKLKAKVIGHYSNGNATCVKCGFSDMRALCIDHINGGGNKHRNIIKVMIYSWLSLNNYPEGFQVLCFNCNAIKQAELKEYRWHDK